MPMPRMIPVTSSMLESMGYDREARQAYVKFNSGKVYRVNDIAPTDYADWTNSASVGTHFNRRIKSSYIVEEYIV